MIIRKFLVAITLYANFIQNFPLLHFLRSTPTSFIFLHNILPNPNSTGYTFDSTPYSFETDRLLNMENIQNQPTLVPRDHGLDLDRTGDLILFVFIIVVIGIAGGCLMAFVGLIVYKVKDCIVLIPPLFSDVAWKVQLIGSKKRRQANKEKKKNTIPLQNLSRRDSVEGLPEDLEAQVVPPRYPESTHPGPWLWGRVLVCLLVLLI